MKKAFLFLVLLSALLVNSVCFAASESAKNLMAVTPLVGGLLGGYSGHKLHELVGGDELGDSLFTVSGAILGLICIPKIAKNNINSTEGINTTYLIVGSIITTGIAGYFVDKTGIKDHRLLANIIVITIAYTGARIGASQSAIIMPVANLKF
ncbi:MAG: hypothetical protein PHE15_05025 [Dehalococcoidales bacterium]|nr:hypothetical protein [Dehalococcoidales bacterium]